MTHAWFRTWLSVQGQEFLKSRNSAVILSAALLGHACRPERLHEALAAKAQEFDEIPKAGRTHLQDATPLTVAPESEHEEPELASE